MNRAPREDIPLDPGAMIDIGTVVSVDLANATCIVNIGDPDEDEAESPPIKWGWSRAGKTRIWSPPSVGEQVLILKRDGEIGNAVVIAAIPCDDFPPAGNSETELILFDDDTQISYDPLAHAFELDVAAGGTVKIVAPGNVTIEAPLTTIEGDVQVNGTLTADTDVIGGGKSLKTHKHTSVAAGAALSGPPQ